MREEPYRSLCLGCNQEERHMWWVEVSEGRGGLLAQGLNRTEADGIQLATRGDRTEIQAEALRQCWQ